MKTKPFAWMHFTAFLVLSIFLLFWMSYKELALETIIRVGSYVFFLNLVSSLLLGFQREEGAGNVLSLLWRAWRWPVWWHLIVGAMAILGGVLGAVLFLIFGTIFEIGDSVNERLVNGLKDGAYYFSIWSPGGAIVLLFILGHRRD